MTESVGSPPPAAAAIIDTDLACSGCGYNLRTQPEDGACPECGQSIAKTREDQVKLLRIFTPDRFPALSRSSAIVLGVVLPFVPFFILDADAAAGYPPLINILSRRRLENPRPPS